MLIRLSRKAYWDWINSNDSNVYLQHWDRIARAFCDVRVQRLSFEHIVINSVETDYGDHVIYNERDNDAD